MIEDEGIGFGIHVAEGIHRKIDATRDQRRTQTNPFLPYEEEMFVADLSDTHVCLLNKFTVVPHHVLMVTREYASQDSALDVDDFRALWRCLVEIDGLAFYNGGRDAGASQPHKHFQLVPLPLEPHPNRVPIAPWLARVELGAPDATGARLGRIPGLPFRHVFADTSRIARLARGASDGLRAAAEASASLFRAMGGESATAGTPAYNLLATRDWMLFVARSRSRVGEIPMNALGYAGSLLVLDEGGLADLTRRRPMSVLAGAAVAPD